MWNWQGINGDAPLVGRPIVLTKPIRAVIALAVYFTFCIFAGELTKAKELAGRAWHRAPHENPHCAYRPQFGQTPKVVRVYTLEYLPTPPDTEATKFGSVPHFSFLPPFHKQVSIDRVLIPPKD
jgi:hypothetical protein